MKHPSWLIDGQIKFYEEPTETHEKILNTVVYNIRQLPLDDFDGSGSLQLRFSTNIVGEPDQSITPNRKPRQTADAHFLNPNRAPYPSLVIEVGKIQSLESLHRRALLYLGVETDISIVVAFLYDRDVSVAHPSIVISFGSAPLDQSTNDIFQRWNPQQVIVGNLDDHSPTQCTSANIPTYQIHLPSAQLYHGDPNQPIPLPPNISLDLFKIIRILNRIPDW
ncbi:hypothetical protein DFA_12357 [Cavenderia fasciculata]|uniref:Restriction endonuclease domain-containing protein n=1 Tax=Cavenderia fasciculata TaxID=261658 RepID=F4QDG2_CACFS|nr:uncharacterized protein DFA_12357 [Cavenderia fasciculata]EGG14580.1 hypothetical protein DFA_12357 [Cavenderia fasciculata]|eukprot:XP_004366100.1 hypothetical protein DFA_12357 [Cavenderia fasciculata]